MNFAHVLDKFAGMPPSTSDELDEVLIALIQKHAAEENKWASVANELTKLAREPKDKHWCKNRAKKAHIRDHVCISSCPLIDAVAPCRIQEDGGSHWRAKLGCFRVDSVGGKGIGVFATANLKKGDLIIEEEPVLAYMKSADLRFSSGVPGFIESQWKGLSSNQRDKIMELHDVNGDKSLAGILRTNALSRGAGSSGSVLCVTISRFNHSCSPNCQHAWDEAANVERVFACTDIKVGEELCIYYIDVCSPTDERQRELHARYGFECLCAPCANCDFASDARRSMIKRLDQSIMQAGMFDPRKGVAIVEELLSKYDEEGINILSLYGRACYDAFQLSLALRDMQGAKKWIGKAHQYHAMGEGPSSPSTLMMLQYTRNPTTHRLWM